MAVGIFGHISSYEEIGFWPKIGAMKYAGPRAALWVTSGLLVAVSGREWLSYVGNGIAYGAVLGLPGYENAPFGTKALHALIVALTAEGLAVAAITWDVTRIEKPIWRRLVTALVVSVIATSSTFAFVRGM